MGGRETAATTPEGVSKLTKSVEIRGRGSASGALLGGKLEHNQCH